MQHDPLHFELVHSTIVLVFLNGIKSIVYLLRLQCYIKINQF